MIRNDISNLLPDNPPLSLEEYVAQLAEERASSPVYRARDHQRADPHFAGMLAAPVVGPGAMLGDEQEDPLDPMGQQQQSPAWDQALSMMQGAAW